MSKAFLSRLFLVASLLVAGGHLAEPGVASAQQSTLRLAVVDMNQAMNEVEEGKAAKASLEKKFAERKAALDKKQKDLQAMQDDLERKSLVMSEEAKKNKAKEFQEKYTEFQQARMEAEQEMGGMQQQLQDDLSEKLKKVLATVAQKQGYSLVVEKAVTWYSLPQYDITNDLIKAYNAERASKK